MNFIENYKDEDAMFQPNILAANIKKNRNKLGLTQPELAERLSISSQAISKWECGQSIPDLVNLWSLSNIFGVSLDKLVGNNAFVYDGKLLIGIDGGGTKTEFVLFTENGYILKRIVLDGCNPNVCGMEKTFSILKLGMDTMLLAYPEVAGVFAGIAGYFSGGNGQKIHAFFKNTYPALKVTIGSDIFNVISSAVDMDKCIAAVCGTGFSVYANVRNKLHRVGGWGYLLDTKGSGCDIGRDALRAALAQRDGFGEKTLITPLVEEKIGGDIWENLNKIYAGGNSFIASFAPLVFEAYRQGDGEAERILHENAQRIAQLVSYAAKTYDCGNKIVLAGGLISHNDIMKEMIEQKLDEKRRIIIPSLPQIYGACVRCCRIYGELGQNFTENFEKCYKEEMLWK